MVDVKTDVIDVYSAIQDAFGELYKMARLGLKKRWGSLTREEKIAAARSLVFMRTLQSKPARYFARANTGAEWAKRANDFAEQHNFSPSKLHLAYYIVQAPKDVVCDRVQPAWIQNADMGKVFYRFCALVQDWEYNRSAEEQAQRALAVKNAQDILNTPKRYAALRKTMEPSKVQAWIQKKFRSLVK